LTTSRSPSAGPRIRLPLRGGAALHVQQAAVGAEDISMSAPAPLPVLSRHLPRAAVRDLADAHATFSRSSSLCPSIASPDIAAGTVPLRLPDLLAGGRPYADLPTLCPPVHDMPAA